MRVSARSTPAMLLMTSSGEVCQFEMLMRIARFPSEVVVPEKNEVPSVAISAMTLSFHSLEGAPDGSGNVTSP